MTTTSPSREEPTGLPHLLDELIENARLYGSCQALSLPSPGTAETVTANLRDANRYRLEVNRRKKALLELVTRHAAHDPKDQRTATDGAWEGND